MAAMNVFQRITVQGTVNSEDPIQGKTSNWVTWIQTQEKRGKIRQWK